VIAIIDFLHKENAYRARVFEIAGEYLHVSDVSFRFYSALSDLELPFPLCRGCDIAGYSIRVAN